jgi:hypothetical protein
MADKSFVFRFAVVEVREREFSLKKAGEVLRSPILRYGFFKSLPIFGPETKLRTLSAGCTTVPIRSSTGSPTSFRGSPRRWVLQRAPEAHPAFARRDCETVSRREPTREPPVGSSGE